LTNNYVAFTILFIALLTFPPGTAALANMSNSNPTQYETPTIFDHTLDVELVYKGIAKPTDIEFLGDDDVLVLEKNEGTVKRITNGEMLDEPLLDVNVANQEEQGMLGMAIEKKELSEEHEETVFVFLYYTEAAEEDGGETVGNNLYRYELTNNELVNPRLLLELPADPGPYHNGGKIEIGPDGNLYIIVGDIDNVEDPKRFKTQNSGEEPDGRAGILRIGQQGEKPEPLLGEEPDLLGTYYAYGIRNGYGIDFDPITKELWDTENGPTFGDEINLVKPGFNSGWDKTQGFLMSKHNNSLEDLENYGETGTYSDPEFVWNITSGLTALKFLTSSKYGEEYTNDLLVGDFHNGYLYHFGLNEYRTSLALNGPILDKTANNIEELQEIILGKGFLGVTDIEVGPDGYLYIVSYGGGSIWRIIPAVDSIS
jgi:aldose sugar dehydrogenase